MTSRKQPGREEPFLNVVARKLGRAAGTLTNVAQGLTGNISALPAPVSMSGQTTPTTRTDGDPRRTQSKKKITAAQTRKAKDAATVRTPRAVSNKSRRRTKVTSRKKK